MDLIENIKKAYRQEWGIREPADPKQPICNLSIEVVGWEGNYPKDMMAAFLDMANRLEVLGKFHGKYRLLRDGDLVRYLSDGNYHTYSATLNLCEPTSNLSVSSVRPHLHLKGHSSDFAYVRPELFKVFLPPMSINPHYTLKGLYSQLPDKKISTRIAALEEELEERIGFEYEGIMSSPEAKLKFLEYQYKKQISDQ